LSRDEIISAFGVSSWSGSRRFALWIGGIGPLKNPLEVAKIAAALPDIDFVMIGSAWDRPLLDRLNRDSTPNLFYLGPLVGSAKTALIRKCSVGISTSAYETFGWPPLEFLAEGKPVLAYPLKAFKEIYGDLITYCDDTNQLVQRLRELINHGFRANIDQEAVRRLLSTYNFDRAASKIISFLGSPSFTIFTRDVAIGSDWVAGFHIVNWQLWKSMAERASRVRILSDGIQYSRDFGLQESTKFTLGSALLLVKDGLRALENSPRMLVKLRRKALRLTLLVMEPALFVFYYLRKIREVRAPWIIAAGQSQILAAVMLKQLLRLRVACILHDARFASYPLTSQPFLFRIYQVVFARSLRFVDWVMVVSNVVLEELVGSCPYLDNIRVIWQLPDRS